MPSSILDQTSTSIDNDDEGSAHAGVLEAEELHGAAAAAAVAEAFAASEDVPDAVVGADDDAQVEAISRDGAAAAAVAQAFAEGHHLSVPPEPEVAPIIAAAAAADDVLLAAAAASKSSPNKRKQKKRTCKFPGCANTVKAQGHCQRHGAKTKRCKAPGCSSQAQGSHEGHCKRHWRELLAPEDQRKQTKKKKEEEATTCQPVGSSVYEHLLPASFAWKIEGSGGLKSPKKELRLDGGAGMAELGGINDVKKDVLNVKGVEEHPTELVPILQHLLDNESLDPGWHRSNERLARGIRPPKSLSTQLETWEKQLAVMEMALIAGTDTKHLTQHKISKILAHGWGREKGFHKLMIEKHCKRRGDLDRKKRVDAGKPMDPEKRAVYKMKFEATKAAKRRKVAMGSSEEVLVQNAADDYHGVVEALPPVNVPGGEAVMGEVVNVDDQMDVSDMDENDVPFAEAPAPHLEEPPIEAMEEPSIEEMVTEVGV